MMRNISRSALVLPALAGLILGLAATPAWSLQDPSATEAAAGQDSGAAPDNSFDLGVESGLPGGGVLPGADAGGFAMQPSDDINVQFNMEGTEYPSGPSAADGTAAAVAGVVFFVVILVELAIAILILAGMWKMFVKAGKPGWAAIIPIYNMIVILEIVGRPIWWILLLLIPCVNIVVSIIVFIDLAKSFGKDALFGILLWLFGFIFIPVLGFGSAKYQGPAAAH